MPLERALYAACLMAPMPPPDDATPRHTLPVLRDIYLLMPRPI